MLVVVVLCQVEVVVVKTLGVYKADVVVVVFVVYVVVDVAVASPNASNRILFLFAYFSASEPE